MTPDQWTSLRLPKKVRGQLEEYRAKLTVQVRRNPERFPKYLHDNPLSLASAVCYLLEQQRRHTARAGAHKLSKGKQGPAKATADGNGFSRPPVPSAGGSGDAPAVAGRDCTAGRDA